MAKAYYSTTFREPPAEIWKIVRDFNNYPVWVSGAGESQIEDRKSGDAVGAIRSVQYKGRHIRQRLLALSDVERSQTYEFCGASSLPMTGFKATLRIFEIVDGGGAFVEWWADFDCEAERREELCATLSSWFGGWLESLRTTLGAGTARRSRLWRHEGRALSIRGRFGRLWRRSRTIYRVFECRLAVAFRARIWHRTAVAGGSPPPTLSDAGVAQW